MRRVTLSSRTSEIRLCPISASALVQLERPRNRVLICRIVLQDASHKCENHLLCLCQNEKRTPTMMPFLFISVPDDVLLSHTVARAVPSAQEGLTSEFGMGSGVSPPLLSPENSSTNIVALQHKPIVICCEIKSLVKSHGHISTTRLNTLLCLHLWPINLVIYKGPSVRKCGGISHLGRGFVLRCFQRLSFPNIATQPCRWSDNWYTSGSSVPVLSY